jgi:hypothetical protein
MLELKRLSKDAVPGALGKAERYRLLNEPANAESICLDILAIEPDNQQALTTIVLAITDQFRDEGVGRLMARAKELIPRLDTEYARLYYGAIICERRARAHVAVGAAELAHDWFAEALRGFEHAMAVRPPGNDDAILRWNACARALDRLPAPHSQVDVADSAIMSE